MSRGAQNKDIRAYKKKLDMEFNKKQIEIKMEAQNAVREREKALHEKMNQLRYELEQQKLKQKEYMEGRGGEADGKAEKEKKQGEEAGNCVIT